MTYRDRLKAIEDECAALNRLCADLGTEAQKMSQRGEDTGPVNSRREATVRAYFELMLEQESIIKYLSHHGLTPDDRMETKKMTF